MFKKLILIVICTKLIGCSTAVDGKPWNEERQCWERLQEAGYTENPSFDDGVEIAISPEGRYWKFLSPAIPDNFTTNYLDTDPSYPKRDVDCP